MENASTHDGEYGVPKPPKSRLSEAKKAQVHGQLIASGIWFLTFLLAAVLFFAQAPLPMLVGVAIFGYFFGAIAKVIGGLKGKRIEDEHRNVEREYYYQRSVHAIRRNLETSARVKTDRAKREADRAKAQVEWDSFVNGKQTAAKRILDALNVRVVKTTVPTRWKAIVEVAHKDLAALQDLRRHIANTLEAELAMHVELLAVRFCDLCGFKLPEPFNHTKCPGCQQAIQPLNVNVNQPIKEARVEVALRDISELENVGELSDAADSETSIEASEPTPKATLPSEFQCWDRLDSEDWLGREELERNVPEIQARLNGLQPHWNGGCTENVEGAQLHMTPSIDLPMNGNGEMNHRRRDREDRKSNAANGYSFVKQRRPRIESEMEAASLKIPDSMQDVNGGVDSAAVETEVDDPQMSDPPVNQTERRVDGGGQVTVNEADKTIKEGCMVEVQVGSWKGMRGRVKELNSKKGTVTIAPSDGTIPVRLPIGHCVLIEP